MDASRLLALLEALEQDLVSGYEQRLGELLAAFTGQRDNPSQDLASAIEEARRALEAVFAASTVNDFVSSQQQMMESIGASDLFGAAGLEQVASVINTPGAGPATVAKRLEEFQTRLQSFRQAMTQTRQGLAGLRVRPDVLADDEYEVGVILPLSVLGGGHLEALNKHLKRVNEMLRALQELAGEQDREVRLRGTATGSLLVFIAAGLKTAEMVASIAERIASLIKRVLKIRVILKEMEDLELPPSAMEETRKEEKNIVESQIGSLVRELIDSHKGKLEAKRVRELETQLTVTVKHIVKLVDEGGSIEVSTPPTPAAEFTEATERGGQPLDPEQLKAAKEEWERLQGQKANERKALKEEGASIRRLPRREKPVLNLPEPEEPSEEPPEDAGKEGRPPKRK